MLDVYHLLSARLSANLTLTDMSVSAHYFKLILKRWGQVQFGDSRALLSHSMLYLNPLYCSAEPKMMSYS